MKKKEKRYTGEGGGVLYIDVDGFACLVLPQEVTDERVNLLVHVAANMGGKEIGIQDVGRYKGESQIMLECLRTGNAAFFRSMADAIKPRPAATRAAKMHSAEREGKDKAVYDAIIKAANKAGGKPSFEDVLRFYRSQRLCSGETPADLKRKLKTRGFAWLCER